MVRKLLTTTALAAAFITTMTLPSSAWKFATMADSRANTYDGPDNGVNVTILRQLVQEINGEGVDLLLFPGDAIMGPSPTDPAGSTRVKSQMTTWINEMDKLNCPWYFAPGNHEAARSDSADQIRQVLSETNHAMPMNGPVGQKQTVYSFDHKNAHFVAVNTNVYGFQNAVTTDQQEWLKADLSSTTQQHTFVMGHVPGYFIPTRDLGVHSDLRTPFWDTMEQYGVEDYFCGHEHIYSRSDQDGVWQVIAGGAGASGNQYGYVVVEVNGWNVTGTAKSIDGGIIDRWSYVASNDPSPSPIPEPSTAILFAVTFPALAMGAWRLRRAHS